MMSIYFVLALCLVSVRSTVPTPMVGSHYFAGWYNCSGYPSSACYSHFKGYNPTGSPVENFFTDTAYARRTPLLGLYTTDVATISAEVKIADSALDFFSMLYYDQRGGLSCGTHPTDLNLAPCLDSSLAFMLNTSAVWEGTSHLHFFVTYSNDVDSGASGQFVGEAGADAWLSLVGTWVRAMAHPRYLRIAGRPVFQVLIPNIFVETQCSGNATLANELVAQLRAAGSAAGVGDVLVGGGWQNPSVPNAPTPPPRPAPAGYMQYTLTDIPCDGGGASDCDVALLSGVPSPAACQAVCNTTASCAALVYYSSNETCRLKGVAGPGAPGLGDTYVRVLPPVNWEWTGTYNDAQPVCPSEPNWLCPQYNNSWWPNATPTGAKIFPYEQCAVYQAQARGNHSNDTVPYVPNVIASFDPRPWEEQGASFTFPALAEWTAALQQAWDLVASPSNHIFGFPDPTSATGIQPAVTIYAWNEFGEGGIVAPTTGDGYMKVQAIAAVFRKNVTATENAI